MSTPGQPSGITGESAIRYSLPVPEAVQESVDVSIILPVFNEQGHLVAEVDRIRASMDASSYSYEIIVVDDGSTDGSAVTLETIPDIRLLRFRTNRGSGSARKFGTRAARGRVVVWTDVDMTYPNDKIPELVAELDEGWDQVVGARTSEEGTVRALRVPAKWVMRKLASYLVKTRIPDLNSGFRAFRRDVALQYMNQLPPGFSCVTTITMAFLANGYTVHYQAIPYAKRAGKSKFHWYRDTRRYLTQIIRMCLSYDPLRVFIPVALLFGLVGTGKLIYDSVNRDFGIAINTVVLLFVAFMLMSIGLLADLVVRSSRARDEVQPAALLER